MPHKVGHLFEKITTRENVVGAWEDYNRNRPICRRREATRNKQTLRPHISQDDGGNQQGVQTPERKESQFGNVISWLAYGNQKDATNL